jgi:hypothetical protein
MILFPQRGRSDVLDGTIALFRPLNRQGNQPFGHGLGVLAEIFEQTPDTLKAGRHPVSISQRANDPAKNNAIPT